MIGILYICTGRYRVFWKQFYRSCEKYFLPDYKKKYIVFTDAKKIHSENNDNVYKYYQEKLDWPGNTLYRFETFLQAEADMADCDFIFFINSNSKFDSVIGDDILPNGINDNGLVVAQSPAFFLQKRSEFKYEKNPLSTAYIPNDKGTHYFIGGLNGGQTAAYLEMIKILCANTIKDLENNIIAVWHDESHINNYMIGKTPKILGYEYVSLDDWELPYKTRLLFLDKAKYGGIDYLRGKKNINWGFYFRTLIYLKKNINRLIKGLKSQTRYLL
jgi:hypothetical protein